MPKCAYETEQQYRDRLSKEGRSREEDDTGAAIVTGIAVAETLLSAFDSSSSDSSSASDFSRSSGRRCRRRPTNDRPHHRRRARRMHRPPWLRGYRAPGVAGHPPRDPRHGRREHGRQPGVRGDFHPFT